MSANGPHYPTIVDATVNFVDRGPDPPLADNTPPNFSTRGALSDDFEGLPGGYSCFISDEGSDGPGRAASGGGNEAEATGSEGEGSAVVRSVIVVDTNVISELMRGEPHPAVLSWVAAQPRSLRYTTYVSQAEILYGIAALPEGRRRTALAPGLASPLGSRDRATNLHDRNASLARRLRLLEGGDGAARQQQRLRDVALGGLKSSLFPVLRLAEQRPDVLLEHGERRIREPRFQVGGLRDQDRGAACRLEIGNVLHCHHGCFREQPTETSGVDSLGGLSIDAEPAHVFEPINNGVEIECIVLAGTRSS